MAVEVLKVSVIFIGVVVLRIMRNSFRDLAGQWDFEVSVDDSDIEVFEFYVASGFDLEVELLVNFGRT